MEEKKFELRKLQATDLFKMVKILNLIGFKNIKDAINTEEINKLKSKITKKNEEEVQKEIGTNIIMSIVFVIIEHIPDCEDNLYEFLGSVAGMKKEDVATLSPNDFIKLLIDFGKKDDFKDFFSQALKLIK